MATFSFDLTDDELIELLVEAHRDLSYGDTFHDRVEDEVQHVISEITDRGFQFEEATHVFWPNLEEIAQTLEPYGNRLREHPETRELSPFNGALFLVLLDEDRSVAAELDRVATALRAAEENDRRSAEERARFAEFVEAREGLRAALEAGYRDVLREMIGEQVAGWLQAASENPDPKLSVQDVLMRAASAELDMRAFHERWHEATRANRAHLAECIGRLGEPEAVMYLGPDGTEMARRAAQTRWYGVWDYGSQLGRLAFLDGDEDADHEDE